MEILDIYDSNGNPTGKKITRGKDKLNENEFIKLVVVWIEYNGKYLIQKTSKEKDSVYAITGGHLTSGNSETEQIVIEVREAFVAVEVLFIAFRYFPNGNRYVFASLGLDG